MAARSKSKERGKKGKRKQRAAAAKPAPTVQAKPVDAAATPGAPPQEMQDLGAPPDDALAQQAYLYKLLVVSAYDVARDVKLSPRERRKELRVIAASAQKLMPRARLHQAEQLILDDRAELEKKARERRGAKLEALPKPSPPAPAPAPAPEPHVEEPQP